MEHHYAQLDADGYCCAITSPGGGRELEGANLVEIPEPDPVYLGRRYADGQWV